jgi:hypothetical protein
MEVDDVNMEVDGDDDVEMDSEGHEREEKETEMKENMDMTTIAVERKKLFNGINYTFTLKMFLDMNDSTTKFTYDGTVEIDVFFVFFCENEN